MLKVTLASASTLAVKALPVPNPPMPGTSPAQALPLQTGQTRQNPSISSRAVLYISFIAYLGFVGLINFLSCAAGEEQCLGHGTGNALIDEDFLVHAGV
ncbi:MAG: hypothetical protein A4E66_02146 [Syntrophus sp. PtaB.Bin001]|nr:MAG: hypothetical protein A4E66_02146 [Syntrophus sp. PtaB.Bin001]